ncbi:MAG: hypothetical protein INH43_13530 [Acidobacteriaceae bacterium]|nr:hypothetical protein [Acidobacteriaceae bacterium]
MESSGWERHYRVLLISIPDTGTLRAWAAQVPDGALVGMGSDEDVARARSATADFDHVMFHRLDAEEIPWRDGYFDVVLDPLGAAPAGEAFARERARVDRGAFGDARRGELP